MAQITSGDERIKIIWPSARQQISASGFKSGFD
jgi:hypothetical protein